VIYRNKNKHSADANLKTNSWALKPITMSLGGVIYTILSFGLIFVGGLGLVMLAVGLIYFLMMGAAYKKQVAAYIEEHRVPAT
jgi:hypothetical protein